MDDLTKGLIEHLKRTSPDIQIEYVDTSEGIPVSSFNSITNMDSQTLQLVIAMQKALCDLLSEEGMTSTRIDLARHVALDAARIIREHGQQPEEVPQARGE